MAEPYITFAEYQGFGGTVSAESFPKLERKAQHLLDDWTYGRIAKEPEVPDAVKECLAEMVDAISKWGDGQRLTTFSNGKVSMGFDTSKTEEQDLYYSVVLPYLPDKYTSMVVDDEN